MYGHMVLCTNAVKCISALIDQMNQITIDTDIFIATYSGPNELQNSIHYKRAIKSAFYFNWKNLSVGLQRSVECKLT